MKNEWRKIIDVHSVILYKDDLEELVSIISECDTDERIDVDIILTKDDRNYICSTFYELIENNKNIVTDQFSISSKTWTKENHINKGISLTMYHNYISYQIYSSDETWFLGKVEKLNKFFLKRKPWYGGIGWLKYFFPSFILIGLVLSFKYYNSSQIGYLIFTILFTLIFLILSIIGSKSKLFPFVKIHTTKKEGLKMPYNLMVLIIGFLALIVSLIGLIIK